jgi:hypothetical protein
VEDGDTVESSGVKHRVRTVTDTPATVPTMSVTLVDGATLPVFKMSKIRIYDPDGSVLRRIANQGGHGTHWGEREG